MWIKYNNNVGGFYLCVVSHHFCFKRPITLFSKKLKTFPPIQWPICRNIPSPVRFRRKMEVESEKPGSDGKVWNFCRMPFWQTSHNPSSSSTTTTSSSTSYMHNVHHQSQSVHSIDRSIPQSSATVSSVAKSLLPTRRRLRLDPPNKLYFPCMCLLKLVCSLTCFLCLFIFRLLFCFNCLVTSMVNRLFCS